jgi:hypothetical protein
MDIMWTILAALANAFLEFATYWFVRLIKGEDRA